MQVEKREVKKLAFDPNNARKHNKKNIKAIKGSLQKFGLQKPIVIDKYNVVLAGNGTLEAAKELGWETIDVVVTTLDEINKKAYSIADNKSHDLSSFDADILDKQLLSLTQAEFDISDIGFSPVDLDDIVDDIEDEPKEPSTTKCPHCGMEF